MALAVAGNLIAGLVALRLARKTKSLAPAQPYSPSGPHSVSLGLGALSYFAAGFAGMASEVVWTRVLLPSFNNSVYGFSMMLGAYLIGLGGGSMLMARRTQRLRRPIVWFGLCEVTVALLSLGSLHVFTALGVTANNPDYTYSQIWKFADFGRLALTSLAVVLPVTIVLGATFPIASRLARAAHESAEVSVGRLYGYNTVGAVFGSFATGFVLRAWGGSLAVGVETSESLVACVFTLCLFMGFGKRRCEIAMIGDKQEAGQHRRTLLKYTPDLLNYLITV